jgi:hypothetical protein
MMKVENEFIESKQDAIIEKKCRDRFIQDIN